MRDNTKLCGHARLGATNVSLPSSPPGGMSLISRLLLIILYLFSINIRENNKIMMRRRRRIFYYYCLDFLCCVGIFFVS